jgi:hypothetical protein
MHIHERNSEEERMLMEAKDREWRKVMVQVRRLKEMGAEAFFRGLQESGSDLAPALRLTDRVVRCIDEGTPKGIHLAGSGILVEDRSEMILRLKEARAEGVTSHEGCGAAVLAAKKMGRDPADANALAQEFAQALAEELGVPYMGHIPVRELERPPDFHNAIAVYVTGRDFERTDGLPSGFTISRHLLGPTLAIPDIALATHIALNQHGFGEEFTPDFPLHILAVADRNSSEDLSQALLDLKDAHFEERFDNRVRIDGFTV